jgi:hypothetical protein
MNLIFYDFHKEKLLKSKNSAAGELYGERGGQPNKEPDTQK